VTEQVDYLATPSLTGGPVDEERVLDAAVDGLRVRAEAVTNPYLREAIDRAHVVLYEAA